MAKRAAQGRVARGGAGGTARAGGISDEAVRRATGKGWGQWFRILDRFGAAEKGHKAAAIHVSEAHACGDWWSQMVVVGYEKARGLRQEHERPDGYSVSASKTIAAPVGEAFRAFADARARRGWLPGVKLEIRKATEPKSLRITFVSGPGLDGAGRGPSDLDVNLYAKGPDKCQLQVQHGKLASAGEGEAMRAYWREALERLKGRLEA